MISVHEPRTVVSFLPRMAGRSPPRLDTAAVTNHGACTTLHMNLNLLLRNVSSPSRNRWRDQTKPNQTEVTTHPNQYANQQGGTHLKQRVKYPIRACSAHKQLDDTVGGRPRQQPCDHNKLLVRVCTHKLAKLGNGVHRVPQLCFGFEGIDTNGTVCGLLGR
jgi:hypothetical protein